jgi:sec-independent protein translocase protein TatA
VFNIGPLELIVVLIIALIVLGPHRLPEVARSVGRGMREFRSALEREHDDEDDAEPPHEEHDELPPATGAAAEGDAERRPPYQNDAESSEPSSSSSGRV